MLLVNPHPSRKVLLGPGFSARPRGGGVVFAAVSARWWTDDAYPRHAKPHPTEPYPACHSCQPAPHLSWTCLSTPAIPCPSEPCPSRPIRACHACPCRTSPNPTSLACHAPPCRAGPTRAWPVPACLAFCAPLSYSPCCPKYWSQLLQSCILPLERIQLS